MKSVKLEQMAQQDYPVLKIHEGFNGGFIVLFTSENTGTVVYTDGTHPLGRHGELGGEFEWCEDFFSVFNGKIEVSN